MERKVWLCALAWVPPAVLAWYLSANAHGAWSTIGTCLGILWVLAFLATAYRLRKRSS